VWLRVRILNSAVFNFNTTVRAIRLSLRDAAQVSWASLRIIGSVSLSGMSRSNVSSPKWIVWAGRARLCSGQFVETNAVAPKAAFEFAQVEPLQICNRVRFEAFELFFCAFAHSGQTAYR